MMKLTVQTPSQDISSPQITPSTLSALLPIIWTLITQPLPAQTSSSDTSPEDFPKAVGTALLGFLSRQSASSALRSIGDEFIIRLLQVHEQPYPTLPFFISPNSDLRAKLRGWIEGVPKALWELGGKDEKGTERLLGWLLDMGMRGGGEEGYSLLDRNVSSASLSLLGALRSSFDRHILVPPLDLLLSSIYLIRQEGQPWDHGRDCKIPK